MPSELFDLTGKRALVTGGSRGLGKAMARGFAEAGADVMICSRKEEELQAARGLLVVWSQHSVQSTWVIEEATEGKRIGLPIFGVLLDEVLPPFGFRLFQAADFSKWDGSPNSTVFQNLVSRLINNMVIKPPRASLYKSI